MMRFALVLGGVACALAEVNPCATPGPVVAPPPPPPPTTEQPCTTVGPLTTVPPPPPATEQPCTTVGPTVTPPPPTTCASVLCHPPFRTPEPDTLLGIRCGNADDEPCSEELCCVLIPTTVTTTPPCVKVTDTTTPGTTITTTPAATAAPTPAPTPAPTDAPCTTFAPGTTITPAPTDAPCTTVAPVPVVIAPAPVVNTDPCASQVAPAPVVIAPAPVVNTDPCASQVARKYNAKEPAFVQAATKKESIVQVWALPLFGVVALFSCVTFGAVRARRRTMLTREFQYTEPGFDVESLITREGEVPVE